MGSSRAERAAVLRVVGACAPTAVRAYMHDFGMTRTNF